MRAFQAIDWQSKWYKLLKSGSTPFRIVLDGGQNQEGRVATEAFVNRTGISAAPLTARFEKLKRPGLKACSGPFVAHARFAPRGSLVDFIGFYGAALAAT